MYGGYLVVVSLGLVIVVRLVPPDAMDQCRKGAAETFASRRPVSKTAAAVVILVWIVALALIAAFVVRVIGRRALKQRIRELLDE